MLGPVPHLTDLKTEKHEVTSLSVSSLRSHAWLWRDLSWSRVFSYADLIIPSCHNFLSVAVIKPLNKSNFRGNWFDLAQGSGYMPSWRERQEHRDRRQLLNWRRWTCDAAGHMTSPCWTEQGECRLQLSSFSPLTQSRVPAGEWRYPQWAVLSRSANTLKRVLIFWGSSLHQV